MANARLIGAGGGGGVDTDSATATTADVLTGYTFGSAASDDIQTGSMPNIGAQTITIGKPTGSQLSTTIKKGYHNGSGYAQQSITNRQSTTYTMSANGTVTILEGWYTGGTIKQELTTQGATTLKGTSTQQKVSKNRYMTGDVVIKGDANLVASNIKKGVTIFGVTGNVTDYAASQVSW